MLRFLYTLMTFALVPAFPKTENRHWITWIWRAI